MNIEIADRLVKLRKRNGLSQEALAEQLGISRQAVSKWERAEASPDTDNIIMLARLYKVSLDELLQTEDEIPFPEPSGSGFGTADGDCAVKDTAAVNNTDNEGRGSAEGWMDAKDGQDAGMEAGLAEGKERGNEGSNAVDGRRMDEGEQEYGHIGPNGIHVLDKDGSEVRVGWDGIHVDDKKQEDNVHIDRECVYVNGEKYGREWFGRYRKFPVALFIVLLFFILGVFFSAWHPAWMLFLLPPLWYSLLAAVEKRNAHIFAYPVLATLLFLCVGFFFGAWHPGWVIFLTIPLYYPMVSWLAGKGDEG